MNTLFDDEIYSFDTSAFFAAFHERYPIDYFPTLWGMVKKLIQSNRLKMSQVIYEETVKDSEVKKWFNQNQLKRFLHVSIDESIQARVREILSEFPRLIDTRRQKSGGDPWCIALALITDHGIVVTEEKPTDSVKRPHIPDVCLHFNIEWINLVELIKRENWII